MKACIQYCQKVRISIVHHPDACNFPTTANEHLASLSSHYQVGGVILVAPEHRNSLLLKWHEMRLRAGNEDVCSALEAVAGLRYQDLLDESDELLHHR